MTLALTLTLTLTLTLSRRDPTRPVQYENARIEPGWDTEQVKTLSLSQDPRPKPRP